MGMEATGRWPWPQVWLVLSAITTDTNKETRLTPEAPPPTPVRCEAIGVRSRMGGEGMEREELRRRLAAGESLEIFIGGGSYEVWTEPYADPPVVFYEGCRIPYAQLEDVVSLILTALEQGRYHAVGLNHMGFR